MADPAAAASPASPNAPHPGELEAQLEDALRRAKTQLSHIRGNLALVATFLTRAEQ